MNNRHRAIKRYRAKRFKARLRFGPRRVRFNPAITIRAMDKASAALRGLGIATSQACEAVAEASRHQRAIHPLIYNSIQLGRPCLIIIGIDAEREDRQIEKCEALGIRYVTKHISELRNMHSITIKSADSEALADLKIEPIPFKPLVIDEPVAESFNSFIDRMMNKIASGGKGNDEKEA